MIYFSSQSILDYEEIDDLVQVMENRSPLFRSSDLVDLFMLVLVNSLKFQLSKLDDV